MAIDVATFQRLKARVQQLQTAKDQAAGALQPLMSRLAADHGCNDVPTAEALALQLDQQAAAAEQEYANALAQFQQEWGDALNV